MDGHKWDTKIHVLAKDKVGEWHGSQAENLLREDTEKRLHLGLSPKQFHLTQEQHKEFELDTFRQHIFQEKRSQKESLHWNVKKEKKKRKKQAKKGESVWRMTPILTTQFHTLFL